ncbi:hypothetical protein G7Y89_g3136 [Cudoniella acicularis]|uniref:Uncharacterized protein n=1 Tax=Cudoniella acicularis TaxID=354080 RepID=A0A8H4RTW1_9HELO|nr:hypothetical protein G7Y89_g3136 [Cudoniella acicularis]
MPWNHFQSSTTRGELRSFFISQGINPEIVDRELEKEFSANACRQATSQPEYGPAPTYEDVDADSPGGYDSYPPRAPSPPSEAPGFSMKDEYPTQCPRCSRRERPAERVFEYSHVRPPTSSRTYYEDRNPFAPASPPLGRYSSYSRSYEDRYSDQSPYERGASSHERKPRSSYSRDYNDRYSDHTSYGRGSSSYKRESRPSYSGRGSDNGYSSNPTRERYIRELVEETGASRESVERIWGRVERDIRGY